MLVAVVSTALEFPPETLSRRLFTDPRFDRLMVTGDHASADAVRRVEARGIEVIRVPVSADGRPDLAAALRALGGRGARSVVTEGGPRLLTSLLRAHLVREYFLTTSPFALGGADAPRPIAGALDRFVLTSRISRIEHAFRDPGTGAPLVEGLDRFRVVYPEAPPPAEANA